MKDSIKETIEKLCMGCNWRCSVHFILKHDKSFDYCPCSICIVKLTCDDNCERWTEWNKKYFETRVKHV